MSCRRCSRGGRTRHRMTVRSRPFRVAAPRTQGACTHRRVLLLPRRMQWRNCVTTDCGTCTESATISVATCWIGTTRCVHRVARQPLPLASCFYASFAADDGEVRRGARARGALPPVAPNRRRFRVRRPDVHGPQPNNGHVCTSAFLLAACHPHRRALWHAAVARAHSHVPCVLCQGREKGLTKLRLGFWLDIVNSPYFALGTSCRENGKLDSELFRVDARGRGTEQWRHVGYQLAVVGH